MKLPLHQGAYQARSPIANAQVSINLYSEPNTPDAPFPVTAYPAPGLVLYTDYGPTIGGPVRGLYTTSQGNVIAAIAQQIVNVTDNVILGATATNSGNPVSMVDNGTTLVAVDGTSWGGQVPLASIQTPGSLQTITDPGFYGSTRVDFIDTFMIFNQPGTGNFYTTTSNVVTPFDPTYFAAKEGWNDLLVCCACLHDNIWLLGESTAEIWFNAGGATFPFARMPNSILQQGCVAPYSVVVADNALYWLSQDRWGRNMLMRGEGYAARRVSTFAVEEIWNSYITVGDAVGMAYQLGGHEIIGQWFPTANAWWAYDASTQLWHQRTYNGLSDAWLPSCMAFSRPVPPLTPGGGIIAGARNSGQLYIVSRGAYTDDGIAITRQRSWAHLQQDGQRIAYQRFALSMAGSQMSPDTVALDWSDDAGQSYGSPVNQTINNASNGQYLWRRLGYGRDRVYRATWAGNGMFALNGAYSDGAPAAT